jgi:hypothetical protein
MNNIFFDDQQEIGPLELKLLSKVLADILRDRYLDSLTVDELELAKELVALFKSGFRTAEELKAMTQDKTIISRLESF